MKVIYLGTPDFAVPALESIINSDNHSVVAVVTQPDRPVGRKNTITPPPVKVTAEKYGIPVYQFEKIRTEGVEILRSIDADIMVTCAYGQILSQEIIDICKFGIINVHASLLPAYRGAAPIQFAVINGEKKTGVTIMQTEAGLDTGDIIEQYETEIRKGETAGELAGRLSKLGAEKICEVLSEIENGNATRTKQDDSKAFVVKTIKKENALIDFSKSGEEIEHFVLGMNPSPVAFTYLRGKKLKIYRAAAVYAVSDGKIGEVIQADKRLIVKTGNGDIEITELQEEGGKKMDARSFLLGRKIAAGDVLGESNA